MEQFKSCLKVWQEATTTSPSGVDLSHYKALVSKNDLDPVSTEADLLEIKRKQLIQAHVQLINYATTHRYSYERWKTIVSVMIQKEPGNSKIHRLRVHRHPLGQNTLTHLNHGNKNYYSTLRSSIMQRFCESSSLNPNCFSPQTAELGNHSDPLAVSLQPAKPHSSKAAVKHVVPIHDPSERKAMVC